MEKGLRVAAVKEILESLEDAYGYVNKRALQLKIAVLKEEKINVPPAVRINHKEDLIRCIEKYRQRIRKSELESSLTKKKIAYFNALDDKLKQNITYKEVEFQAFRDGYLNPLQTRFGEITPENFVYRASEMMEILKISKPTMTRLSKLCSCEVSVKCMVKIGTKQVVEYNSRDGWISFYSLNKLYAYLNGQLADSDMKMWFY